MSLRNYLTQFFLLMIKKIEFGNARRQSCLCDDIEAYLCGVLVDAAFFGVSDKRTFFYEFHWWPISFVYLVWNKEKHEYRVCLFLRFCYVFGTQAHARLYASVLNTLTALQNNLQLIYFNEPYYLISSAIAHSHLEICCDDRLDLNSIELLSCVCAYYSTAEIKASKFEIEI